MTQLFENWPMVAGAIATALGLIPIIRAYTAHLSHRSSHEKSQIDALQKISDFEISTLTPEQALVLDATLDYAYGAEISIKLYNVLRRAKEPAVATKRFRHMRPFVELTKCGNELQYKKRKLLFSKRKNTIPVWRVNALYTGLYFAFASAGLFLLLMGAAAAAKGYWVWTIYLIAIGAGLVSIGGVSLIVGQNFHSHIKPFTEATKNIFDA